MQAKIRCTAAGVAFFLVFCAENTQGPLPTEPAQGVQTQSQSYVLRGDTITTIEPQTSTRCDSNNVLVTQTRWDTNTSVITVLGNTLRATVEGPDTLRWGVIKQDSLVFTRQGAGSGFQGTWVLSRLAYGLVMGALTAAEKDSLDSVMSRANLNYSYRIITALITADSIHLTLDLRSADVFVDNWNGLLDSSTADSAVYDIGVRAMDRYTVELTGRKTGEIVRKTEYANRDRIFVSSDTGHAEYRYYGEPRFCPAPSGSEPAWYRLFLNANVR